MNRIDPTSLDDWIGFFQRLWRSRQHLLDLVLDADRIRESWIQADAFLAARTGNPPMPQFYCNRTVPGYGGSPDWSYWEDDREPLMVAEVKMLAGGHQPKVFGGEGVKPGDFFSNRARYSLAINGNRPILRTPRLGWLLGDYVRLRGYDGRAPLRMMVLVLDKREMTSRLGYCLDKVEFDGQGKVVLDTPKWRCKVWEIKKAR